ncbi:MAG: hypothetical protein ACRDF7_03885 [Candidatus Limnocylindrales bacterium]
MPEIGPAPVLAVLIGIFHVALYVFLRGGARGQLLLLLVAAILGAYAGQALGGRVGDPVRIGDFGLISSSLMAWLGIGIVIVIGTLGRSRDRG